MISSRVILEWRVTVERLAAALRSSGLDCKRRARFISERCSGLKWDQPFSTMAVLCSALSFAHWRFALSLLSAGVRCACCFRMAALRSSGVPQLSSPSPPSVELTNLAPAVLKPAIHLRSASAHDDSPVPYSTASITGCIPDARRDIIHRHRRWSCFLIASLMCWFKRAWSVLDVHPT